METAITPEELQAYREYKNALSRAWWARQSESERRERRQRYAANMMRKRQEEKTLQKWEVKSKKRGKQ